MQTFTINLFNKKFDIKQDVDGKFILPPELKCWENRGTALKPSFEPILICMKPLDGTFAHNAEAHGVAGLNIDGGRIGTVNRPKREIHALREDIEYHGSSLCGRVDGTLASSKAVGTTNQGRWPANLILDEEAGAMLDKQTGNTSQTGNRKNKKRVQKDKINTPFTRGKDAPEYTDSGGASRFFYCAKTSRKERNMGMGDSSGKKVNDGRQTPIDNPYQRGETIRKNTHPTVKPLALMKYLCTLLKMPSAEQIILDPFMGSGTTAMACASLGIGFIGIEKELEYCEISAKRISAISGKPLPVTKNVESSKTAKDFTDDSHHPSPVEVQKQKIINAAVAKLRNRKSP